jgi:hypothetical protein
MESTAQRMMLSRPLPAEFTQGELGTGWFYERYAAFSWGWTWRRSVLFGAFFVPYGALLGLNHGLYAHSGSEGMAVGARAAFGALLLVALAPSMAAFVRHRHWPLRIERPLLLLALALGIVLSGAVRAHARDFHDHLMGVQADRYGHFLSMFSSDQPLHAIVGHGSDFLAALFVQALCGGVLALRSYLTEPQRWRDHAARQELEALRRQKLAAEARLAVLQAQVEPHFLFNTLASVGAQIESDPRRAGELANALAGYLRATLPRLRGDGSATQSTLGEQFDICRRYLEVMALRMSGRLTTVVDLPDDLATLAFPPLLLISLVENAVTHGIEPKRGGGRIQLVAHRRERQGSEILEVRVCDDGPGLKQGLLEGTGISNVRSQLGTLYGSAAQLQVESVAGGGVCATLSIPLASARP